MTGLPAPIQVSVIVPTYGRPVALGRCLASLALQGFPREAFEVVVVDDGGNPPADLGTVRDDSPGMRVTLLREPHRGPGAARMAGIGVARGDILAFLDDDCSVSPDYLTQIVRAFTGYPELAVAQVRLENPDPDNLYGIAWKVALAETLRLNVEPRPGRPGVCGILGGVMVCRREVFAELGYDPALPGTREDADFRLQLQTRGIRVHYVPEIVAWNHCRHRLRDFVTQHAGYGRGEFDLRRKWGTAVPSARYPDLLAWRSVRTLMATHGPARGAAVYALFWVKRYSGRAGLASAAIKHERPGEDRARWARVALRLVDGEARWLWWRARAAVGARVRGTRRRGSAIVGRDEDAGR